jgi:hypothetical protein
MADRKTIVDKMNSATEAKLAAKDITESKIMEGSITAASIATYNKLNFTKVYSQDHTFPNGARSGFHYDKFLSKEQFLQPLKWKWVVTLLNIDGPNKNTYVRNCSHVDNSAETGVFWFEYYYFSAGSYLPGVQVDNRSGSPATVRVELFQLD